MPTIREIAREETDRLVILTVTDRLGRKREEWDDEDKYVVNKAKSLTQAATYLINSFGYEYDVKTKGWIDKTAKKGITYDVDKFKEFILTPYNQLFQGLSMGSNQPEAIYRIEFISEMVHRLVELLAK
jgi:hypothetical protein